MAPSAAILRPLRKLSEGTVQAPHTRIKSNLHGRRPDEVVKDECKRFRVLVMGRRNAGKTTLLKKMTQSSDGRVEVRDEYGNLVDHGRLLEPSVERGQSRIDWEITFPSNPGYVFHDSRGMEAGSTEEIDKLNDFMERRSKKRSLEEQLHVIWYCLPVDSARPLCKEEMAFFENENGTYGVPVVAIFTKFEARVTKALGSLRDNGVGIREARRRAPEKAQSDFKQDVLDEREARMKHKPSAHVFLQEMHLPKSTCGELTKETHRVVDNKVVYELFARIQRNSVEVSLAVSLVYAMSLATERIRHFQRAQNRLPEWTALMLSMFPYWVCYPKSLRKYVRADLNATIAISQIKNASGSSTALPTNGSTRPCRPSFSY
ncbi:hypothetical protein PM082_021441 [Marasmius tenuissimus]|nr:hypothetical protein PM082_021441 [Marasmius tenuissimus]